MVWRLLVGNVFGAACFLFCILLQTVRYLSNMLGLNRVAEGDSKGIVFRSRSDVKG